MNNAGFNFCGKWLGDVADTAVVPFSFIYNGASSRDLLGGWTVVQTDIAAVAGVARKHITWRSSDGLECRMEMKTFDAYPAVEWVLYFKNTGTENSAIIENVQALDVNWQAKPVNDGQYHRQLLQRRAAHRPGNDFAQYPHVAQRLAVLAN